MRVEEWIIFERGETTRIWTNLDMIRCFDGGRAVVGGDTTHDKSPKEDFLRGGWRVMNII